MTLQPFTPHTPYSPPLCRLEHRATSVLLRDLLADPAVVSEMHADPYIAVHFRDLLNPTPPTHATTSTPLPTSHLPHNHAESAAAAIAPTAPPAPQPDTTTAESHTALPLRHRIYALYCEGYSLSAIARDLALDRGTVTRHLRTAEAELAQDHTADLARLRLRAVEAQYAILAAAWESLAREELRESSELAAAAVARENGERPPAPYRAQRARLLATAAHAARTAAQLQGLFTHPAPIALPTIPPTADLPTALTTSDPNSTAASCGMPASIPASLAESLASASATESPRALHAPAPQSPPIPPLEITPAMQVQDAAPRPIPPSAATPAASCGMPASVADSASPLPVAEESASPIASSPSSPTPPPSSPRAGLPVALNATARPSTIPPPSAPASSLLRAPSALLPRPAPARTACRPPALCYNPMQPPPRPLDSLQAAQAAFAAARP